MMLFYNMKPLEERYPVIEVSDGVHTFDLHNQCVLASIEFRFRERVLVVSFRSSQSISGSIATMEAGICLVIEGVREVQVAGNLAMTGYCGEPLGIDFVEYSKLGDGTGQLRFVFDNEAEITATGQACRLTVISSF